MEFVLLLIFAKKIFMSEQKKTIFSIHKSFVFILFLIGWNISCYAQNTERQGTKVSLNNKIKNNSLNTNLDTLSAIPDTVKIAVVIPKDSAKFSINDYLFTITDSIIIEKWKYNTSVHHFSFSAYDSTLREFHITHPAYKRTINNNYLGSIGLAVNSNLFFEPNPTTGYLFLNSFTPYIYQAATSTYYNVRKPFTLFLYQTGPTEEQNIEVIHTQNISRFFNASFQFKNYTNKGAYTWQESKNNSGNFAGSFVKSRFSTHLSFTFSKIDVQENGGIIDPYFITDTILGTAEIKTRLKEGHNYIKDRQWFIDQKVGFIKVRKADTMPTGSYLFSFQYNYSRQKSLRIYEDKDEPMENTIKRRMETMYLNNYGNSNTFDSTSYISNKHLLRLNLEEVMGNPLGFGSYFGIGTNFSRYFYKNKDTLFVNELNKNLNSSFLESGIFRLNPNSWLNFYANYRHYISGYRINDFNINAMILLKIAKKNLFFSEISAFAKTESKAPDYFIKDFYSNHYKWQNNFKSQNISELRIKYHLPKIKTTIGARYALITNYIYFNNLGKPTQFNSDFNVLDFHLDNTLSFFNFYLINKVFFQESGKKELLPLPKWSFYNALYYQRNIHFDITGGDMKLQFGIDVNFWTAFYAQAYSPATAQFHLQNNQKTGNYPFVGAFLNLEIKRMRIYIKAEHLNYSYMQKQNQANYFLAPNYPATKMAIKYGISWSFYD